MPIGTVLNFFVKGVKPLWEDPACKQGGRFNIRLPKTHTSKYWEDLLMAMIGEQFSVENEVLGCVLSTKPNGDGISVWHRHANDEKIVSKLKEDISSFVNVQMDNLKFDHESFQDLINQPKPQGGTFRGRGGYVRGRGRGGYHRQPRTETDDDGWERNA